MCEIEFKRRAVAFLDILGFQVFIKKAERHESKEYSDLCALHEVVKRELDVSEFHERMKPTCTFISDSIILSAVENDNGAYSGLVGVSIKAIQVTHQLLKMGFLVRGGISIGPVSHNLENIYGSGYIEAYETEMKAGVPRILLHDNAARLLNDGSKHLGWQLNKFPIFARDGEDWILDTLYPHRQYIPEDSSENVAGLFNGYREKIIDNLKNLPPSGKEWAKWSWMANFFNDALNYHSELGNVNPIAPELTSVVYRKREAVSGPGMSWWEEFRAPLFIGRIQVPPPK